MMNTKEPERWREDYEIFTRDREELANEIKIMEDESQWISNIPSKTINLTPVPSPIESNMMAKQMHMDPDITYENATEGTKLILDFGTDRHWNISPMARTTLCETAKLTGSSLGRMHQIYLAQNLNNSLDVAKGETLILVRHNKVMALHSDAAGGYCIMPISKLLKIAERNLAKSFGTLDFKHAYHTNGYTSVVWELPDAQNDILDAYQNALKNAVSQIHAINFMPAVRFSTSDTQRSSAFLTPIFKRSTGTYFKLVEGVAVKHEKSTRPGQMFGLDLFEVQSTQLFAKFNDSIETVKAMAETEIYHPVNCFVGICNYLNRGSSVISRKYADAARQEVERFAINCPIMSMHDIYLSMSECLTAAQQAGASKSTIFNIEEAIAKVLTLDWKAFDIGGTVAWGDRKGV